MPRICEFDGCVKRPSFGRLGTKKGSYCREHAPPHFDNVVSKGLSYMEKWEFYAKYLEEVNHNIGIIGFLSLDALVTFGVIAVGQTLIFKRRRESVRIAVIEDNSNTGVVLSANGILAKTPSKLIAKLMGRKTSLNGWRLIQTEDGTSLMDLRRTFQQDTMDEMFFDIHHSSLSPHATAVVVNGGKYQVEVETEVSQEDLDRIRQSNVLFKSDYVKLRHRIYTPIYLDCTKNVPFQF